MISIVIPTYNEVDNIGPLVTFLKDNTKQVENEIIVSDGGSTDNTVTVAHDAGARVVISRSKGRAAQMNYGASLAQGDILYFIHADTWPPSTFVHDIYNALNEGYNFGRYRTKFAGNNMILKINAFFTRFDWFVCYGGDQTFFITRTLFDAIGGFNGKMQIMEDYEIVTRAKKMGRYKIFTKPATISTRKYETNSWFKVQWANRTIVQMYRNGASQEEMVSQYKKMLAYR